MPTAYDLVLQLTTDQPVSVDKSRLLRDFSRELGWRPSYFLVDRPFANGLANAHLIVEHGLEPSAVITFLNRSRRLSDLQAFERNRLLEISYNNLVDWHVYVEVDKVNFFYNRTDPPTIETQAISRTDYGSLRNDAFDRIVGRKPSPNVPSLDEALIRTISYWKRNLAAELEGIRNEDISALFNAIIFVRAVEDHYRGVRGDSSSNLLEESARPNGRRRTLRNTIQHALNKLVSGGVPVGLIQDTRLAAFDRLDPDIAISMIEDFYHNRHAPYNYNFSLMSKHALSRIYEHYVSLLSFEYSPQGSFFPRLPDERWSKEFGSIYTPQFIARFFSRFLKEELPPKSYRELKTIDPACGSGLFLRTQLELQCDPAQDGVTSEAIATAFKGAYGIDIDGNASEATRLSLASLYLTLAGKLPESLQIITSDSLDYYQRHPELKNAFDAVIVNPPFIATENLSSETRSRLANFMGGDSSGRIDSYLAYLRLSLELLRPGGYGLFVLPHSFLISRSGQGMRQRLAEETAIRCLADLSAIRVFGDAGSYVILLVFQKLQHPGEDRPRAAIVKCQDFVGHALEDVLEGRVAETPLYSVYEVEQEEFRERDWVILPSVESEIRKKVRELPRLGDLANVRQGLITGADDVFIVDATAVPEEERDVYRPFLPDRQMRRFDIPEDTSRYVFYPVRGERKLTVDELQSLFPRTWAYLREHQAKLEGRKPVLRGDVQWWDLVRPRQPSQLLTPKIVTPHLVITPRFSFDQSGRYAVSRTPLIYPKETRAEGDFLKFLLAVLNSPVCYWYVATHSHKYSRGYTMLELKTLRPVPIPDPSRVASADIHRLLALVDWRLESGPNIEIEQQLDDMVGWLYGLSEKELDALGMLRNASNPAP